MTDRKKPDTQKDEDVGHFWGVDPNTLGENGPFNSINTETTTLPFQKGNLDSFHKELALKAPDD